MVAVVFIKNEKKITKFPLNMKAKKIQRTTKQQNPNKQTTVINKHVSMWQTKINIKSKTTITTTELVLHETEIVLNLPTVYI